MSEEETLCEQAEQDLGELYDEEVANFYKEAKINAGAARARVSWHKLKKICQARSWLKIIDINQLLR